MSYEADISSSTPACVVFLVDQSESMSDPCGMGGSKASIITEAINRTLEELCIKCNSANTNLHYVDVGVIGYGANGVGPIFAGDLAKKDLVSVYDIAANPLRVETRVQTIQGTNGKPSNSRYNVPVWIEALHGGLTPMCEALCYTGSILSKWINTHPSSFPPVVVNITDGEANDGDPCVEAIKLTDLSTEDGSVLLFNCHISEVSSEAILFPTQNDEVEGVFANQLLEMSSIIPKQLVQRVSQNDFSIGPTSRGYIFNGKPENIIKILRIGTIKLVSST